ncbi:MAG: RDD family protein [Holophagae bacterium]|nr:RDD family protein [Holophagae bacterium]
MVKGDVHFVGIWPRFFALLVDFLLFCAIFFLITKLVKGVWMMSATDHRWNSELMVTDPLCIIFLVVMGLYFVFLEGWAGATLGKWVFGLRVEQVEGGKPGLVKGLSRNLLRVVDGLPALNILGIFLIVTSKEHARFGDRIAGTRVIRVRKD